MWSGWSGAWSSSRSSSPTSHVDVGPDAARSGSAAASGPPRRGRGPRRRRSAGRAARRRRRSPRPGPCGGRRGRRTPVPRRSRRRPCLAPLHGVTPLWNDYRRVRRPTWTSRAPCWSRTPSRRRSVASRPSWRGSGGRCRRIGSRCSRLGSRARTTTTRSNRSRSGATASGSCGRGRTCAQAVLDMIEETAERGRRVRRRLPAGAPGARARRRGDPVPRDGPRVRLLAVGDARDARVAPARHRPREPGPGLQRVHRQDRPDRRAGGRARLGPEPRRRRGAVPSRPADRTTSGSGSDIEGRPVVVCVSRLVPRKGQDVLDPGDAPDPPPRPRRRAADRRRRAGGGAAAAARRGGRARRGPLRRRGERRGPARGTTRSATCSRCRAATASAGSRSRAGASSSSRPPPRGRPVVVGDSGGARETLVDGETGFLVDGGDVAEVADAVGDAAGRSEPRRGDGQGGPRVGRARAHVVAQRRTARRPGSAERGALTLPVRRASRGYPATPWTDRTGAVRAARCWRADAAWCGQCYAPVAEPEPEPEPGAEPPPPAAACRRRGRGGRAVLAVLGLRRPQPDRGRRLPDLRDAVRDPDARRAERARPVPAREAVIRSLALPGPRAPRARLPDGRPGPRRAVRGRRSRWRC